MSTPSDGLYAALLQRGLSRRTLLKFGAAMAPNGQHRASYQRCSRGNQGGHCGDQYATANEWASEQRAKCNPLG